MIEIIPAIDLLDGKCVRLLQGKYTEVTQFNTDPVEQALLWQEQGAKRIHLVDLDGAKTGMPINDNIIKLIVENLKIPIQIGGGIRTVERAEELINLGVSRIIVGTIAIEEPKTIQELANKHRGKIVIAIDVINGKVATKGWINQSNVQATDLVKRFSTSDLGAFICTDISTDGTLKGPNITFLEEITSISNIPVIASGGIGSISDVLSILPLEEKGIAGLIIGRALYDKELDLKEALKVAKNVELTDSTFMNNDFA